MSLGLLSRIFGHRSNKAISHKLANAAVPVKSNKPLLGVLQPDEEALKLKQAVADANLRTATVMSLIEFEQDLIQEFLDGTTQALKIIVDTLAKPASIKENLKHRIQDILCIVHQIKGDSAILNLTGISRHTHQFENKLCELSLAQRLSTKDLKQLVPPLKALIASVKEVKTIFEKLVSGGWNHKTALTEGSMSLKLEHLIKKLSEDCGKRVMVVNDGYTDKHIPANLRRVVSSLVTQLARNSVAHGIEPEQVRKELQKTPYGCFHITAQKQDQYIEIITRDDGRGIDCERIRETALKTKRYTRQQLANCPDDNLLRAIFIPGLTTFDKVTEHAGRGVGMDLIKKTVEKHKGSIDVKSTPGQFTEFTMRFPIMMGKVKPAKLGHQLPTS